MGGNEEPNQPVKPQLGLWDAVSIMVGIVIGASIYESPPLIFNNVTGPEWGMGVWVLGGVLSLIGALCYAELASTYPRMGGDYVYLSRAFGPWAGFLFGWAQLVVVITASIGSMAFVFGRYATQLWPNGPAALGQWAADEIGAIAPFASPTEASTVAYAVLAVLVLTFMNLLGVVLGKGTQNVLTVAKVVGMAAIAIAGLLAPKAGALEFTQATPKASFGLAMIFVLYAYGGWNDMAFVASELRDRRNIVRALLLGTGLITAIYLVVNVAYILGLGFAGAREFGDQPVASRLLGNILGESAGNVMAVIVMISALGAINGLIFTGSRVYSSLGTDWKLFAVLGHWNRSLGSPLYSLSLQAIIALAMIVYVGSSGGRRDIDAGLTWVGEKVQQNIGLERAVSVPPTDGTSTGEKPEPAVEKRPILGPLPWGQYYGGFGTLVAGTAPVFWIFFLMTGLSLFALRERDRDTPRVFAVPLYPIVPLIFCCTCFYMLYSAIDYANALSLLGFVPLALGLPLYFIAGRRKVVEKPVPKPEVTLPEPEEKAPEPFPPPVEPAPAAPPEVPQPATVDEGPPADRDEHVAPFRLEDVPPPNP